MKLSPSRQQRLSLKSWDKTNKEENKIKMAEESSDQKVTGDDQKAVFTSIKDSFFDDPFFKVRIRIIKRQFYYNVLYHFFIERG